MRLSTSKKTKKIAILIPCYNEEEGIANVIKDIPLTKLRHLGFTAEIIVIDNNSTDRTAEICHSLGVKVIFEPKKGKGNAIRTGFSSLSEDTDFVVMLDGDNTYKPEEIPRLIEPLANDFCDVVIGSRLGGKTAKDAFKFRNRIGNWMFTFLTRQFYRANVTDVLSGFFAWKKKVVDVLNIHLSSEGFPIEMEMITKTIKLGFEMYSVPITYDVRKGETKLSAFKDGILILFAFASNLFWRPKLTEVNTSISETPIFVTSQTHKARFQRNDSLGATDTRQKVSVVIPALNEEPGIRATIKQIPVQELTNLGYAVEVIIVDNGSTDKTAEISRKAGARVVTEPMRGYGNAYKAGFAAATGDIIATGDADMTYPFDALPDLIAQMNTGGFDFVTTDRLSNLNPEAMTFSHVFGNWLLSLTTKVLFGWPFRDSQSGMWIFKRSILKSMNVTSSGMPFSQELKIEAYLKGFKCAELPIEYRARTGHAKLNTISDGLGNIMQLFRKRLSHWKYSPERLAIRQST